MWWIFLWLFDHFGFSATKIQVASILLIIYISAWSDEEMVCFLPKSWLWMVKHHQRIILVPSTITDTKVNYWSKIIPKTHEFYWLADFNWTHQPCYSKIRSSRPNSIERSLNSHIIFDITPTFDIKLYTPLFLKSREKDYINPLINRTSIPNSEMRLDLGIFWLFDIFCFDLILMDAH